MGSPNSPTTKSFQEMVSSCRAIFPEQRALVERLLSPMADFILSSKAGQLMDTDEAELRRQAEGNDEDGVADEAIIERMQRARRRISTHLGSSWQGLQAFTVHPLADLKSGLSLSIETVGQMKEVGKGILEELVNAGKERTAAAVSAVGVDLDKEAISRRGGETTSTRRRCAIM